MIFLKIVVSQFYKTLTVHLMLLNHKLKCYLLSVISILV